MQIRTFEAPTLDEALRRVRESLGRDALIVSTDQGRRNGPVRVTAARERKHGESDARRAAATGGTPVDDPVPVLRRALADSGVDGDLATALLAAAHHVETPVAPDVALAAAFDGSFRFRPLTTRDGGAVLAGDARQTLILVGPPGAGKTVTAAKLAARARISNASVRAVSVDTRKTGGAAHLEALAQRLTIGVTVAHTPPELAAAVSAGRSDITVIDSFGVNPFDAVEMAELAAFAAAARAEPVLVLPAGVEALDAQDIAAAFAGFGCRRAIVTRIDLTRRPGSLLSAFYGSGIGFCDVSVSPDILPPESGGLLPSSPLALARLILPDPAQASAGNPARIRNAMVLTS